MKPVSDRAYQPVGWTHDSLHPRQGRKDGKEKIRGGQGEVAEPAQPNPLAKQVQKVSLSVYNRKGEVNTGDSTVGQQVDLQG
jgi:hypothetical protein